MGKMTRQNCFCGDTSIDNAEHNLFHYERWTLAGRNLEIKVGELLQCKSEQRGKLKLASCPEALLKSKKFDLDEGSRMDV